MLSLPQGDHDRDTMHEFWRRWRSSWRKSVMKCHHCKCDVTPVKPKTTWKLFTVAFWITTLVVAIGFSVFAGIQLVLLPMALFISMAIGASVSRLNSWTCPRCRDELIVPMVPLATPAHST